MSSPSVLIVNQQHQRLLVSLLLYSRYNLLLTSPQPPFALDCCCNGVMAELQSVGRSVGQSVPFSVTPLAAVATTTPNHLFLLQPTTNCCFLSGSFRCCWSFPSLPSSSPPQQLQLQQKVIDNHFKPQMFHHDRLIEKLDAIAVCDIETGQTNVIVDIDESRWGAAPGGEDDWQQQTTRPRLLPIVGDVDTQMSLQILSTIHINIISPCCWCFATSL